MWSNRVFRSHISLKHIKLSKNWQNMYPNAKKVFGETSKYLLNSFILSPFFTHITQVRNIFGIFSKKSISERLCGPSMPKIYFWKA